MIDFKSLEDQMDETRRQIGMTESKHRRWELHRHLTKLKKEYRIGKLYYYQQKKKQAV